jgi:hypothetical protein
LKVRDGERPAPLHLIRRRVELNETNPHRRFEPVTSCVIEPDLRTNEDRQADAVAAVNREEHDLDRRVLQAVADNPDLTSATRIRPYVGARNDAVIAAVHRLIRKGCLVAGARNQPFRITDAGHDMFHVKGSGNVPNSSGNR